MNENERVHAVEFELDSASGGWDIGIGHWSAECTHQFARHGLGEKAIANSLG